jgi:hypothetical protein
MDDEVDPEQAEAMDFLKPLLVSFHEGWHGAQSTYQDYDPQHAADHDDTTVANCIRCHMWAYVQNQIDGMPGVTLLNARGLKLLNYYDRYVLRFKQVDKFGIHQNVRTDQQNDFDQGEPLPDIPPAAIRLTSGYQQTAAADAIERVLIARIFGRSVLWLSQINVIAAESAWTDITPVRIDGTSRVDARFRKKGDPRQ